MLYVVEYQPSWGQIHILPIELQKSEPVFNDAGQIDIFNTCLQLDHKMSQFVVWIEIVELVIITVIEKCELVGTHNPWYSKLRHSI